MRTGEYGWTATHCSAPQSGSTVVEGCVEEEAGLDAPATNTDPRGTMGLMRIPWTRWLNGDDTTGRHLCTQT